MRVAIDLSDESVEVKEAIAERVGRLNIIVSIGNESLGETARFLRRPAWWVVDEAFGRDSASLMADFCQSPDFSEVRYEALRMLDREDPSGSFRMVDREVLFHAYCLKILDTQLKYQLDTYVADVTPHEFVSFLWWKLSAWRGFRILFFQPCGIGPFVLPLVDVDVPLANFSEVRGASGIADDAREYVGRFFSRLEGSEQAQWVINQQSSDRASRGPARLFVKFRALFTRGPHALAGSEFDFSMVSEKFQKSLWLLRNIIVFNSKVSLRAALGHSVSKHRSFTGPYVLFLLHYEPERTSRPEGKQYADQFRALLEIRKLVPDNFSVVVKEHYSQVSGALRGHLGRSRHFYALVNSVPNTYLVGPDLDSVSLVVSAESVFTLTGTIGIEGPYLGTRVVYLGAPWWGGIPGTIRFEDLNSWSDIERIQAPTRSEHLENIGRLIAEGMIHGLAGETIVRAKDRWGELSGGIVESHLDSLEDLLALL